MTNILLIVAEDLPVRRMLTLCLARHGHSVAEADSVATAGDATQATSAPFEIIQLDINLPNGTGWDLLRTQPHTPEVPRPRVIVMTAARPIQCRRDEFRPAAILLKPFAPDTLLQLIERTLARARASHYDEAASLGTLPQSERGRPHTR